jgi:hypothetical protein
MKRFSTFSVTDIHGLRITVILYTILALGRQLGITMQTGLQLVGTAVFGVGIIIHTKRNGLHSTYGPGTNGPSAKRGLFLAIVVASTRLAIAIFHLSPVAEAVFTRAGKTTVRAFLDAIGVLGTRAGNIQGCTTARCGRIQLT